MIILFIFAQLTRVTIIQTDRHTNHATCDVLQAMRPNDNNDDDNEGDDNKNVKTKITFG